MNTPAPLTPLSIEDYDAIEAAVMETSRGRWFLSEYARRNRNADTGQIIDKLDRLERAIRRDRAVPDIDRIRLDLADMAEAISRTKQEIAQMKLETEHGGRFADASAELDAIVSQTETATNEILLAAEAIQEAAWTLREAGAADELCDKLDVQATEIYTACSFQDLTGQRTRKVVTVLRYLESRINAMISIWGLEDEDANADETGTAAGAAAPANGPFDPHDTRPDAHLLNGPQLHGRGVDQNAVDDLMWDEDTAAETGDLEIAPEGEPPVLAEDDDEAARAERHARGSVSDPAQDVFDRADVFAEADVFAAPEPEADVFAAPDAPQGATAMADEPVAVAEPEMTTVTLGNTVRRVEVAPVAAAAVEAAPALAVVPAEDPIAALEPGERLVVFG